MPCARLIFARWTLGAQAARIGGRPALASNAIVTPVRAGGGGGNIAKNLALEHAAACSTAAKDACATIAQAGRWSAAPRSAERARRAHRALTKAAACGLLVFARGARSAGCGRCTADFAELAARAVAPIALLQDGGNILVVASQTCLPLARWAQRAERPPTSCVKLPRGAGPARGTCLLR